MNTIIRDKRPDGILRLDPVDRGIIQATSLFRLSLWIQLETREDYVWLPLLPL